MSTPGKTNAIEQADLEEKKITPGCWVEYAAGKVHRVGKVTDILSADETAHAPKVVYSVTTDKGTHEYTNNPSKLTVVPKPHGNH